MPSLLGQRGSFQNGLAALSFWKSSLSDRILAIYGLGIPWLKMVTQMSWRKAFMLGMVPFLIGDVVKASVVLMLAVLSGPF